jgi:hypothetical protein
MMTRSKRASHSVSLRRWSLKAGAVGLLIGAAVFAPASVAMGASAPPPPHGWIAGWQVPDSAFVGRYTLESSKVVTPGVKQTKTKGQLTLFLQKAFASSPAVPAGILALQSSGLSVVLYMTELDHDGSTLLAEIHGGAFVAPRTGTFKLTSLHNGTIVGTLTAKHMAARTLTFKRFSKKPQP